MPNKRLHIGSHAYCSGIKSQAEVVFTDGQLGVGMGDILDLREFDCKNAGLPKEYGIYWYVYKRKK